jgi:hypothetical protein
MGALPSFFNAEIIIDDLTKISYTGIGSGNLSEYGGAAASGHS